jgi:hypothetical protein
MNPNPHGLQIRLQAPTLAIVSAMLLISVSLLSRLNLTVQSLTNANDVTAMMALRQSFNFPLNWNSSNDVCGNNTTASKHDPIHTNNDPIHSFNRFDFTFS